VTDGEGVALMGLGALPMLMRIASHPTVRELSGMGYDALIHAPLSEVLMFDVLADCHDRIRDRAKFERAADEAHKRAVKAAHG